MIGALTEITLGVLTNIDVDVLVNVDRKAFADVMTAFDFAMPGPLDEFLC